MTLLYEELTDNILEACFEVSKNLEPDFSNRSIRMLYRQAVLAVSHKLLRVIHALLRHQVPFNPAHQSL